MSAFNPSSAILAALTVRQPAGTALDLGCGSGFQALLAARHAAEVTAVDVNARAIAFTEFNASLNDVPNVETVLGDWLEPVGPRTFDLVVANPLFVISPDTTLLFRDSPLPGDELCRRLVAEVPGHLREGGYAQVMCDWGHAAGDGWWQTIEVWVESNGCDSWVLHFGAADPLAYAARANAPLKTADRAEYERTLDRWLAYYRESGIEALSSGAVVLRRRSGGRTWKRMASVSLEPATGLPLDHADRGVEPCGEHVLRLLRAQDSLAPIEPVERLLDERLGPAKDQVIDQRLTFEGAEYRVDPPTVRATSGLGLEVPVDVATMQALLHLPDADSLRAAIEEAALTLGMATADLTRTVLPAIRRLVELGLVEVRPDARPSCPVSAEPGPEVEELS